jgi:hypothetical protein
MKASLARRFALVFLLVLLSAATAHAAPATGGTVVFEGGFDIADLTWQQDDAGAPYPVLGDLRAIDDPGRPRLPLRTLLLLVPADANVTDAWVEPLGTHRVKTTASLAVAPPLLTDGGVQVAQRRLPDGDAFPAAWGRFDGTHTWHGYRLVALEVYPLREAADGLEFLDTYAVRVAYGAGRASDDMAVRERLVATERAGLETTLARVIANPERLAGYARQDGLAVAAKSGGFQPDKTPSLSGSAVNYLIITNEAMRPAFEVLANFKTAQGMPTVVATVEFITANYRHGADLQETLRLFIRDAYQKWGLDYVLLGGDSGILPPRYVLNSFYPTGGSTAIPSDLYFACLDGNWNADGDALWAEPLTATATGDAADFAEEVYLGRAAVSTPAEATVFVNKVITYETTVAGAAWPGRTLFAAEVLFPEQYGTAGYNYIILNGAKFSHEQIDSSIIPCTSMSYLRMYEAEGDADVNVTHPRDLPLTRASLIDTLNTGHYGIVNQIGHGYYFNMSVGDANFMTTDADNLVNGNHAFVLYALNCASAAFDNSCLLERFVQNPHGGAVCALGSVRAAFPNNANSYQQEFFSAFYCTGETRAGRLMALSRLPFIGLTSNNYVDRWTFENYTLLGDPTLSMWAGSPRLASIAGPASLPIGPQNVTLTVTAAGQPVVGATVCLQKVGEELVYGTTDALGQVSLPILLTSGGSATVTVTGRNLAWRTLSLPVTAGGAYFKVESATLADNASGGSVGNGNGYPDAGETIAVWPVLRETGGVPATGIAATVSCATAGVTVLTAGTTFANVAGNGATTALTPVLLQLAPTMTDATTITLVFDAVTGGGHSFSEWPLTVRAPQLEVVSLNWDDTTWGNGDGALQLDELLRLTLTLKNYGSGVSGPLTGRLRTDSAYVTLGDSVSAWTSLGLLGEAAGTQDFSLSIDPARTSPARVVIIDSYGRKLRHDFTLPRPDTPSNLKTDTTLGADVIALSWTPSFASDLRGYNVYRSQSAGGPFVRANQDVILGSAYFADSGLAQMTTYYYRIGSVDQSGIPSPLSTTISCSTAPSEAANFPLPFKGETSGPLAVGDVDGDGVQEIVVASNQVYVWHANGEELLDGDNDSQTLGNFSNFAAGTVLQPAAVTLANLDNVPGLEMIISERAPSLQIHVLTKTGAELAGWPRSLSLPAAANWNWAAPAVGDIDGDGRPEIVVNTLNGVVWAWNADGSEVRNGDGNAGTTGVFYARAGAEYEWARSGPSLFDLDGDGAEDIVFGTKNDNSGLKRVMALRYDGTNVAGFPYVANGGINDDVVIGDLDRDGQAELVFYCTAGYLYAVRANGTNYPGFPKATGLYASPNWVGTCALGNLDADPQLEIVYTPNQDGLHSKIVAIDTNYGAGTSGTILPGFPVNLPGSSEGSPVIGDITGDGVAEIVHGIGGGDEAAPYNLYAYSANGQAVAGFPITLGGPLMPGVTITDLEKDGDVDLVYAGWDFLCHVWSLPFAYDRQDVPWPTYKGNMQRTGVYFPVELVGVGDGPVLPKAPLVLERPYPNPFNPSTRFNLYVARTGDLSVEIYDVQGRRVRELHRGAIDAGWHTLVWDGQDDRGRGQASGVYFVRARGAGAEGVQKMTLVK